MSLAYFKKFGPQNNTSYLEPRVVALENDIQQKASVVEVNTRIQKETEFFKAIRHGLYIESFPNSNTEFDYAYHGLAPPEWKPALPYVGLDNDPAHALSSVDFTQPYETVPYELGMMPLYSPSYDIYVQMIMTQEGTRMSRLFIEDENANRHVVKGAGASRLDLQVARARYFSHDNVTKADGSAINDWINIPLS